MMFDLFRKKNRENNEKWNIRTMFGPHLNFAVKESYKLLRTNLMFSFPESGKGHVIGITSSVQHEGKSTTACNLAYTMAQSGASVLLLEADLRRPTVASKLGMNRVPGLTNMLVGKSTLEEIVQREDVAPGVDVIASGDIPPNPSELLGAVRMGQLMEQLREQYEYIVVDLPPVTVVSDALAISKYLDGVVMVVRAGVSDQNMLAEAMRQLQMVETRILGFVFRDQDVGSKKYGYKYSKKYYRYYTEYAKKPGKKA